MMARQSKLRGRVERGMFPNEVAFVVTDNEGKTFTVLVPREFIEERDGTSTLLVRIVDQNNNIALVRLPGEPLDSSTVSVNADQLVA